MILEDLMKRLKKYPNLQNRFNEILNVIENTSGDLDKADDAEMRAIEETRKLGAELLNNWALTQENKSKEKIVNNSENLIRHSKKNSIG